MRTSLLLLAVIGAWRCTTVHVHVPDEVAANSPAGVAPPVPGAAAPVPGVAAPVPTDRDGDGFPKPADCDDEDPAVHPGALDLCGDGRDWDCSGGEELSCVAVDLKVPRFRPTALTRLGDSILVAFTGALEGSEPLLRLYKDFELVQATSVPRARSADALLVRRTAEGLKLWLADATVNLLYRLPTTDRPSIGITNRRYRIDGGRPLAPRALAYLPGDRVVNDVILVGGRHGVAAWTVAASSAGSRSLPDAPSNPTHLATTVDERAVLIASQPDRTLRSYGPDDFGSPAPQRSVSLPGPPQDLAVFPGRALVLLPTGVVQVDLEAWTIDGDKVPIPGTPLLVATDPEGRWVYVVNSAGVLHVVDREARAVVRKIDLTRSRIDVRGPRRPHGTRAPTEVRDVTPTALIVDRGSVLVLLAGNRARRMDLADSFLVVVEP